MAHETMCHFSLFLAINRMITALASDIMIFAAFELLIKLTNNKGDKLSYEKKHFG
jgi:hypothetical protein